MGEKKQIHQAIFKAPAPVFERGGDIGLGAVLLATYGCLALVLLIVLPRVQEIFRQLEVELPALTQFLLEASRAAERFPFLLPLPLLLVGVLYVLRARTPARLLAGLLGVASALLLAASTASIALPLALLQGR
jgi:type II secretory pathway component PulF